MTRCKKCFHEWCSQDFDNETIKCPSCGADIHNTNIGTDEKSIISVKFKPSIIPNECRSLS